MACLAPPAFLKRVVDSGATKVAMATEAIFIRFYMASAILVLGVKFTVTVQFGRFLKFFLMEVDAGSHE